VEARVEYDSSLRFFSGPNEARIFMDGARDVGGLGVWPSPKQLVLHGLAGCTGMDVVFMLEKQKIPFSDFSVHVKARQNNSHPRVFKEIRITYRIRAHEDFKPKIVRAIELSEGRFCGVSAMLAKTAKITWELELLDQ